MCPFHDFSMDRPVQKGHPHVTQAANVIPFSTNGTQNFSTRSTPKRQPKIPGAAMCSKPLPPLIALCEERTIPASLNNVLRTLDAEQLQIVEIIAAAIARGQL